MYPYCGENRTDKSNLTIQYRRKCSNTVFFDILIAISRIFKVTTDYLLRVERKDEADLSGLTDEEKSALLNLIKAMKNREGGRTENNGMIYQCYVWQDLIWTRNLIFF